MTRHIPQLGLCAMGALFLFMPSPAAHAIEGGGGDHARNVILFVGDGMGVSTVTATRVYSVGIDGALTIDQFPFTALSRTYTADHITPDSAGTMTAMMTGSNANSGVIGFGPATERQDFNNNGDGSPLWTLLELAEGAQMQTGVVTTARVTHATPAACYAHVNERNTENAIALQALPSDVTYNPRLGDGIEVLMGGGRRFFVPSGESDEEGESGSRADGRDLRVEFQDAGYTYAWNADQFAALAPDDMPVLGLFERSHMEYEFDRPTDFGGEPSLTQMTTKAIELLETSDTGYFLMVESGRIDHAHHAGNAYRALTDTEEFDRAVAAALEMVNLEETLIIVTADHSHVFTIAGYPLVEAADMPYPFRSSMSFFGREHGGILDIVYNINASTGEVFAATDSNGVPYTILGYHNGPGYRGAPRVDPRSDGFPGFDGEGPAGPDDPDYRQEAAVPLGSETHAGEEVAIYAIGPSAWRFAGTVKNTFIFNVMAEALGLK